MQDQKQKPRDYRSYAGIITEDTKEIDHGTIKPESNEPFISANKFFIPNRTSVRNQIPKPNRNNSFGVWEHTYFSHILELYNIFINETKSILKLNANSIDTLDNFCRFIRECSSGEISPYINELSPALENIYTEFLIKRNESV